MSPKQTSETSRARTSDKAASRVTGCARAAQFIAMDQISAHAIRFAISPTTIIKMPSVGTFQTSERARDRFAQYSIA